MNQLKEDRWVQVSGDVNAADYGCVLAMFDGHGVRLRRIEPVADYVGRDASEVGYAYWSSEAYLEPEEVTCAGCDGDCSTMLAKVTCRVHAEDCSDGPTWEPGPSGWSRDVLPVASSKVTWWMKQGHGWRSADAEFKREYLTP